MHAETSQKDEGMNSGPFVSRLQPQSVQWYENTEERGSLCQLAPFRVKHFPLFSFKIGYFIEQEKNNP